MSTPQKPKIPICQYHIRLVTPGNYFLTSFNGKCVMCVSDTETKKEAEEKLINSKKVKS